jgi:hypothetical protein
LPTGKFTDNDRKKATIPLTALSLLQSWERRTARVSQSKKYDKIGPLSDKTGIYKFNIERGGGGLTLLLLPVRMRYKKRSFKEKHGLYFLVV